MNILGWIKSKQKIRFLENINYKWKLVNKIQKSIGAIKTLPGHLN